MQKIDIFQGRNKEQEGNPLLPMQSDKYSIKGELNDSNSMHNM
jgi:hypothetical protein